MRTGDSLAPLGDQQSGYIALSRLHRLLARQLDDSIPAGRRTAVVLGDVDHEEIFPSSVTWAHDIGATPEILVHPATNQPYIYNRNLSNKPQDKIKDPANTPMFWEANPDTANMRNVAFVDGSVKTIKEAEWQKMVKRYGLK